MPTFLDIGAVRIQPYLGRTPALALRRGASALLSEATSEATVGTWLTTAPASGLGLNQEAGHADGVVSLTVPAGQEKDSAVHVLEKLRQRIPGVEFEARWATADTYLQAFPEMMASPPPLLSLPPLSDFPPATSCIYCRVDAALDNRACVDCGARAGAAGVRRKDLLQGDYLLDADDVAGGRMETFGAERSLLTSLNHNRERQLRPVRDLGQLAAQGDAEGNRNHVATVAVDGNGVGSFFAAITALGDPALRKKVSPELSNATQEALTEATRAITRDEDTFAPVIPHILGGDDVVCSVVADRAWAFTGVFLDRFSYLIDHFVPETLKQVPSLSAGIVFAHTAFPYSRAVELAEEALHTAKRDTQGSCAAIRWMDVTSEGETPPAWRCTLTKSDLDRHSAALDELARIETSGRQRLLRLLAATDQDQARAATLTWARRNGQHTVRDLATQDVKLLRNLVAATRWWKP